MKIQHWMTFATFAEQDYFIYPSKDTYFGIIINGNMAAYAPDGLAAFLLQKNREKMPYVIDPLTHAFQHDPVYVSSKKEGVNELKSSVRNLADAFGGVIKEKAGKYPILPGDFNEDGINDLVNNCLRFQLTHLSERMSDHEVNKYLDHKPQELRPYCLVPPYVFLKESTYSSWINLNIKFCESAVALKNQFESLNLFASIVIDKGILSNPTIIEDILKRYERVGVDGFLVWVDELDEHTSTFSQLSGLKKLASGLRKAGKAHEVINLHGGYFSILISSDKLKNPGFSAVAHGPEFGESRAVVPVGGGIPIARYYLKHLHDRIKYGDAVNYLQSQDWLRDERTFHSEVCDCDICKTVIDGDIANFSLFGQSDAKLVKRGAGFVTMQFPTREAKLRCLKHYLERKVIEFDFVNASDVRTLRDDLENGARLFERKLGLDGVAYLKDWASLLD